MRRLLFALLLATPLGVLAADPQTVVLDVQNMTCELCPITVKKALDKVPGVAATKIDLAKMTATVKFDEAANPVLMNDEALSRFGDASLRRTLGQSNVRQDPPRMVAEDFAHFAQRVPSFYFFIGVGNAAKGITGNLHTAEFDIDEDALVFGTKAMTNLVWDFLESK